ncbi:Acyl-activating enzyme 19-like, partial [Globisporangium splendens]
MEQLVAAHLATQLNGDSVALWRVAIASRTAADTEDPDVESVTWAALCRWLDDVRDALQQQHTTESPLASRIIGIACPPCSVEETALVLAVAREANWVYVPIDVALPVARQVQMLQDANVDTLVTMADSRIASFLVDNPKLLMAGDAVVAPYSVIASDGAGFFRPLRVFSLAPSRHSPFGAAQNKKKNKSASPLYIMYTSGSTGTPKGVVGTRIGAMSRLRWMWETYPFDVEKDSGIRVTKLTFVDSVWEILGSLLKAIPLVHIEHQPQEGSSASVSPFGHVILDNSDAFLDVMHRFHATRFTTIPSILEMLLLPKGTSRRLCEALASLKYVLVSGETFPVSLAMRATTTLPHVKFLNLFGSTEVSGDVTWFEIHAPLDAKDVTTWKEHGVPIGRVCHAIGDTALQLVDGETRVDISTTSALSKQNHEPMSQVHGELYVAGDAVALGYAQRDHSFEGDAAAQAHAELLDQQGWFRTGDWCKVLGDTLYLCGRTDSRVKIRGHRIHLEAVERAIEPALADIFDSGSSHVVALATKDPSVLELSSLCLVAFILPSEDHPAAAATVKSYPRKKALFQRIKATHSDVYVPRDVILVPPSAVTRVPNGKLDKAALETLYHNMISGEKATENSSMVMGRTTSIASASCSIEEFVRQQISMLLGLWCKTTGEFKEMRTRTFQELGGNSLSASLLSWELQQRFQCSIRPHDLVSSTLGSIVNQIKLAGADGTFGKRETNEELNQRNAITTASHTTAIATSSNEPHSKRLKVLDTSRDSQGVPMVRLAIEALFRCNQSASWSGRAHIPQIACTRSSTSTRSLPLSVTLELAWQVDLGKCIDASPLVILRGVESTSGGKDQETLSTWAVIGSHSSRLVCVDVYDHGRIVWRQQLDGRIEASAAVSLVSQLVYVGTYSGSLYALEVETGTMKWQFHAQDAIKASVLVIDALQLVVCGAYDHKVYGLDAVTGVEKWRLNVNGSVFSTPVFIDNAQHQLCIASTSGYLCCISLHQRNDGGHENSAPPLVWKRQLLAPIFSSLNVDAAMQLLLVGCADGNLYAFDTATGELRWKFPTQKPIFSSPTVYNNLVVFGSHDGHLRKVDTCNGKLIWATKLGESAIFGSPALFVRIPRSSGAETAKDFKPDADEDGTQCRLLVCAPTIDGTLYLCDEDTGVVLHTVDDTADASGAACSGSKPLGELFSSPVVVNGMCLIGSRSNQFLAFRLRASDLQLRGN